MNRWDERPDEYRRARLELIKAVHRRSLLNREDAASVDPKSEPPLPEAIDAAWDMPPRSR
jgi:hypothetical protein